MNSLIAEYRDIEINIPTDKAKRILFLVVHILCEQGLQEGWDAISAEKQEEILQTCLKVIKKNLTH